MLQDYPNKELIIFNNHKVDIELSDFIKNQGNIHLVNAGEFDSISDVYNTALSYVNTFDGHPTEYVAIWDDDDIYLPWHLSTAVKYLNKGTHLAAQPVNQMTIDDNLDFYPKMGAISNYCEGSIVVKKSVLDAYGFGPGDSDQKQHPHPQWTSKLHGSIYDVPAEESGFIYFWSDLNRGKPIYTHLQCGNEQGAENSDTGEGRPLYPGPTYFDFVTKNLHLKKFNEEYTDGEKAALVDRINSYDWEFFEERKVFTFWEGEKPYFIEKCLESIEKNSNCVFEVWDSNKLKEAFDDIPEEYDSLPGVEFKADYTRSRVLYERGGLWLDADTIVISDLYEPILKYTWEYDQVTPCESNHHRGVMCGAMACRPKSQVFKKVMEAVHAVMPLRIGWGSLLNTPVKYTIREYAARNMVKYVDESVMSLNLVHNPEGGFGELYCSPTTPISDIVMGNTAGIVLHGSNIRGKEKHRMPDDYLLQRLINKYVEPSSSHFDVVEIGSCDFEFEAGKDFNRVLSVEPVGLYLDKLPTKEGSYKEKAAISNYEGLVDIWYIAPENLLKYRFVTEENLDTCWHKGCNSIDGPHPSMVRVFNDIKAANEDMREVSMLDVFTIERVKCHSIESLFKKYNIETLGYLKVDAEGHDSTIITNYFDYCDKQPSALAQKIRFECNELTPPATKEQLLTRAKEVGYKIEADTGYDIFLKRL